MVEVPSAHLHVVCPRGWPRTWVGRSAPWVAVVGNPGRLWLSVARLGGCVFDVSGTSLREQLPGGLRVQMPGPAGLGTKVVYAANLDMIEKWRLEHADELPARGRIFLFHWMVKARYIENHLPDVLENPLICQVRGNESPYA